jgi:endonuclease G
MTVTIPGTATDVITVGAIAAQVDNAGQAVIEEGPFSSYGPTRDGRCKPELTAPGVGISAARAGTADEAVPRDGTSMAAPHVTGAIALLLSRAAKAQAATGRPIPGANQIAKALTVRAAYSNARWTPGGGFGVVDVTALLAVL